ncbi:MULTISPECIES: DUF3194 domain-containing protein [Halorussus]|uniref:DUF3194 domain-containing protein n=1 Tax=Halorussus TaxID=1070314 RepID=UPI000E217814|nr:MULTISPECIES: DUF3194 domain-containing protein [Halorussus]NHN57713.1 DUF3194 domain-containing protein [Halorussus sp. JP-T4]
MPSDDEIVRTAAEAAEGLIFSRLKKSAVTDVDVTVEFEDGILDVDVYLNAPDAPNEEQIAEDAALTARSAVDDLFAEAEDADTDTDAD